MLGIASVAARCRKDGIFPHEVVKSRKGPCAGAGPMALQEVWGFLGGGVCYFFLAGGSEALFTGIWAGNLPRDYHIDHQPFNIQARSADSFLMRDPFGRPLSRHWISRSGEAARQVCEVAKDAGRMHFFSRLGVNLISRQVIRPLSNRVHDSRAQDADAEDAESVAGIGGCWLLSRGFLTLHELLEVPSKASSP